MKTLTLTKDFRTEIKVPSGLREWSKKAGESVEGELIGSKFRVYLMASMMPGVDTHIDIPFSYFEIGGHAPMGDNTSDTSGVQKKSGNTKKIIFFIVLILVVIGAILYFSK